MMALLIFKNLIVLILLTVFTDWQEGEIGRRVGSLAAWLTFVLIYTCYIKYSFRNKNLKVIHPLTVITYILDTLMGIIVML